MKVLLNCAESTWPTRPAPGVDPLMTRLVDRPFIQHVVESLVQAGFHQIDVLLDSPRFALVRLLEDGTRWGVRIRIRRIPATGALPLGILAEETGLDAGLLLARGDCLPVTDFAACRPAPRADNPTAYFAAAANGSGVLRWTGWAWLTRASLKGTSRLDSAASWQRRMQTWATARGCEAVVPQVLSVRSSGDLLQAQRVLLAGEVPGLQIDGREVEPGVWLARGASIAATTQVHGPVYVGEHAVVRASDLGPFAVVGDGAVVSPETTVTNAVVGARTYVGPHLELRDVVVRGRQLFHAGLDEAVEIHDDSWLQDLDSEATAGARVRG